MYVCPTVRRYLLYCHHVLLRKLKYSLQDVHNSTFQNVCYSWKTVSPLESHAITPNEPVYDVETELMLDPDIVAKAWRNKRERLREFKWIVPINKRTFYYTKRFSCQREFCSRSSKRYFEMVSRMDSGDCPTNSLENCLVLENLRCQSQFVAVVALQSSETR